VQRLKSALLHSQVLWLDHSARLSSAFMAPQESDQFAIQIKIIFIWYFLDRRPCIQWSKNQDQLPIIKICEQKNYFTLLSYNIIEPDTCNLDRYAGISILFAYFSLREVCNLDGSTYTHYENRALFMTFSLEFKSYLHITLWTKSIEWNCNWGQHLSNGKKSPFFKVCHSRKYELYNICVTKLICILHCDLQR
jgi:hypothetical protein